MPSQPGVDPCLVDTRGRLRRRRGSAAAASTGYWRPLETRRTIAAPGYALVLYWDTFVVAASELAGRDVTSSPSTWPAYSQLVRSVLDATTSVPTVLFGPCTPDELEGWATDRWRLLDCSDEVRVARLAERSRPDEITDALADARAYRKLDVPLLDTSGLSINEVARSVVEYVTTVAS